MLRPLDHHIRHSCILQGGCQLFRDSCPSLSQDLTRIRIYYILSKDMALDAVFEVKLLIKFISADFGQVITTRVKEHAVQQAFCTING